MLGCFRGHSGSPRRACLLGFPAPGAQTLRDPKESSFWANQAVRSVQQWTQGLRLRVFRLQNYPVISHNPNLDFNHSLNLELATDQVPAMVTEQTETQLQVRPQPRSQTKL